MNVDFDSTWTESSTISGHSISTAASPAPGIPAASASLKQIVTIRLDVDTLAWFKAAGPGYQTRINQLLREHMEAQQARGAN